MGFWTVWDSGLCWRVISSVCLHPTALIMWSFLKCFKSSTWLDWLAKTVQMLSNKKLTRVLFYKNSARWGKTHLKLSILHSRVEGQPFVKLNVMLGVIYWCFLPPLVDGRNNGGSKRYSRKHEPTFSKAESFPGPRRSQPQKSKNFDKRPPQRGGAGERPYGLAGGGRREEVRLNEPLDYELFLCFLIAC